MTFRAIDVNELTAAAEVQARGFGFSVEDRMKSYQDHPRYDWRAVRVLEEEGRFVASLGTFERTMTLNGGELSAGLVGRVGVPPEERRRGYAKQLMQGLLIEYYEQQLPISLLFPFAVGFYRSLGYGLVNYNYFYEVPPRRLPDSSERRHVRRATQEDADAMRDCYERYRRLPDHNGRLSRTDWEWEQRIWSDDYERVVYQPANTSLQGYLVYQRKGDWNNRVKVIEWVMESDGAWRGIAGFLHALGDQIAAIEYNAPRNDPLVHFMREPYAYGDQTMEFCFRETTRLVSGFMLRVIHLPAALRSRSYPPDLTAGFTIQVTDNHLPGNSAPLHVHIANGSADIVPAEAAPATVEMDMTTFSELYAGALSADDARRVGRLQADETTCVALTRAFATAPLFMHQTDWF